MDVTFIYFMIKTVFIWDLNLFIRGFSEFKKCVHDPVDNYLFKVNDILIVEFHLVFSHYAYQKKVLKHIRLVNFVRISSERHQNEVIKVPFFCLDR